MPLAYRAVPENDAHRTAYRRLLQYAFAPQRGPDHDDDDPPEQPGEFEPRGLYAHSGDAVAEASDATNGRPPVADADPSTLVVCGALLAFRMRIRGEWRPVGGVSAIASPPERRRRGHVGTLLDRLHAELRGRDVAFAALWPFSHPFYRRFGYGRTNDDVVHEFPPEALDAPAATPERDVGTIRRLSVDDVDALSTLHEAAAPEPLALRRSTDWWRLRIFRSWTDERYVYGWEDDAGTLRSYLAYRIEDGDDGRRLVVDYWGATDDEARRHLLAFLRNHDSQVATVRLAAGDASLLDRLSDPDDADTTVRPGPMVRVVDAEAALSGLPTPATDERVVVRVREPRDDWNDGTFAVGVDDGRTTCRRIDDGDGTAAGGTTDGDVTVEVGALSRLVVGSRSASSLATLGDVDGDADAVARLDALFPRETPGPYLRERF
jgi:predicted acetyltransferase